MNGGERLRASINDNMERNHKAEAVWSVRVSEPTSRLFCEEPAREHVAVMAAMLSVRGYEVRCGHTDREGTLCVTCEPSFEVVALREQFMRPFVAVLRRNGVHGTYRERHGDRSYEF